MREDIVESFHAVTGDAVDIPLRKWTSSLLNHRVRLLKEETWELMEELETAALLSRKPSLEAAQRILKEMADVQYVLSGTAVSLGLDLEAAFHRVHDSNMTKIDPITKRLHRDKWGKVLKGPDYQPPYLKDLIYV